MMRWLLARHRTGVSVTVMAAIAVTVAVVWSEQPGDEVAAPPTEEPVAEKPSVEEPDPWRMPLTGVPTDELPDRPALLVKVSNSIEARPQTGLDHADVVFEELTEGGVTRFIAVFHSDLPEVIGPVRSARPVDTQVMSGFGWPGFAYSGARPEVRAMLARTRAVLITEGVPAFFRDGGVHASHPVAPHNLFLRADQALGAVSEAGALPLADVGWVFVEEPDAVQAQASPGTTIDIAMSNSSRTAWTFEPGTRLYRRSQNGVPSAVTGPGRIGAANVVVVQADHYIGTSGYPETNVVGEGVAVVLRDGNRYPARWSKPTATDPLLILGVDGRTTFPFKPGPTWIHLADQLPEEATS